ncbi:DUF58 domain-containing protein [Actinomycetaceae bacterium TAE3-ERU4]|nr:DUF58 domain-containing protein [Actinomycetaceae bacterium TAE3-ERU4]
MLLYALIVSIDAFLAPRVQKLEIVREAPKAIRRGQRLESTVRVTNRTNRTYNLEIADHWPPSATLSKTPPLAQPLRPRKTLSVTTVGIAQRRGILKAGPVTLRVYGPLRLAGRQISLMPNSTSCLVTPPFNSRVHLPVKLRALKLLEGTQRTIMRGAGSEFDSLREYVPGDDIRDIDWRATARAKNPMVRTWQPEKDQKNLIFNDYGRSGAVRIADTTRFEQQIEVALLLTALAMHAGDKVTYLEFAQKISGKVTASSSSTMLKEIGKISAQTTPNLEASNFQELVKEANLHLRHQGIIFILTHLSGNLLDDGLLSACQTLRQRHIVVVVSIDEKEDTFSFIDSATPQEYLLQAGELASELESQRALKIMHQTGIRAIRGSTKDSAPKAADIYLEIKQHG